MPNGTQRIKLIKGDKKIVAQSTQKNKRKKSMQQGETLQDALDQIEDFENQRYSVDEVIDAEIKSIKAKKLADSLDAQLEILKEQYPAVTREALIEAQTKSIAAREKAEELEERWKQLKQAQPAKRKAVSKRQSAVRETYGRPPSHKRQHSAQKQVHQRQYKQYPQMDYNDDDYITPDRYNMHSGTNLNSIEDIIEEMQFEEKKPNMTPMTQDIIRNQEYKNNQIFEALHELRDSSRNPYNVPQQPPVIEIPKTKGFSDQDERFFEYLVDSVKSSKNDNNIRPIEARLKGQEDKINQMIDLVQSLKANNTDHATLAEVRRAHARLDAKEKFLQGVLDVVQKSANDVMPVRAKVADTDYKVDQLLKVVHAMAENQRNQQIQLRSQAQKNNRLRYEAQARGMRRPMPKRVPQMRLASERQEKENTNEKLIAGLIELASQNIKTLGATQKMQNENQNQPMQHAAPGYNPYGVPPYANPYMMQQPGYMPPPMYPMQPMGQQQMSCPHANSGNSNSRNDIQSDRVRDEVGYVRNETSRNSHDISDIKASVHALLAHNNSFNLGQILGKLDGTGLNNNNNNNNNGMNPMCLAHLMSNNNNQRTEPIIIHPPQRPEPPVVIQPAPAPQPPFVVNNPQSQAPAYPPYPYPYPQQNTQPMIINTAPEPAPQQTMITHHQPAPTTATAENAPTHSQQSPNNQTQPQQAQEPAPVAQAAPAQEPYVAAPQQYVPEEADNPMAKMLAGMADRLNAMNDKLDE